mmetsp:Transcript_55836/g.109298  ORF Transcript_55836/g.109298 Transcript_55836/m.109298 type:complete len:270 (+) Transcript_55836:1827-2636(+)
MASSREEILMRCKRGPNTSSFTIGLSWLISHTAGWTKNPGLSLKAFPPQRIFPPWDSASLTASRNLFRAASLWRGPQRVPSFRGSPIGIPAYAFTRRLLTSSYTFSCTSSLLRLVHLCPHVPTAPKRLPRTARSRSASSMITEALLPPSSRSTFPKRSWTATPTLRPVLQEPVKETRLILLSFEIFSPTLPSPVQRTNAPTGQSFLSRTRVMIFDRARWVRGVVSAPFQMLQLPQIRERARFHPRGAAGKLNAVIMPTLPRGWYCSMRK